LLIDDISLIASEISAELTEDKGVFTLKYDVGEKGVLITKQNFAYIANFRIDEKKKELRFTEKLNETDYRFSAGADAAKSLGFGFLNKHIKPNVAVPKEATGKKPPEPSVEDDGPVVNFAEIKGMIEAAAVKAGYTYKYKSISFGL